MAARTCPACQRRFAGLIEPDCVVCGGIGVLTLGAAGLHKNEPAAAARAIEVYLEATARSAAEDLPIGPERSDAITAAVAELRHAGLIADTLTTFAESTATIHALEPAKRRLTVVKPVPESAATLMVRCGIRRRELPALQREDLVRDLLGWSLVVQGARITPLPDDVAELLLESPPGPLFPALNGEFAHAG